MKNGNADQNQALYSEKAENPNEMGISRDPGNHSILMDVIDFSSGCGLTTKYFIVTKKISRSIRNRTV